MTEPRKRSHLEEFLRDGGLRSRKLWLSVFCLLLLCGFVAASARWAYIQGMFSEFVTGVLGVLSIYCGVAAVGTWGTAKHVASRMAGGDDQGDKPAEDDARPKKLD